MKLVVDEIPDDGVSMTADTTQDDWLRQVFDRALHDQIGGGDGLKLSLTATLIGGQVECVGGFYYTIHPTCARCGCRYELNEQLPLHHHYIEATEQSLGREARKEEEIRVAEDEDFSIYEGRVIELDMMLYEQLLLAQPAVYLCKEDCKGLCPRCGTNLNLGACGCKPVEKGRPFEALKGLKLQKNR